MCPKSLEPTKLVVDDCKLPIDIEYSDSDDGSSDDESCAKADTDDDSPGVISDQDESEGSLGAWSVSSSEACDAESESRPQPSRPRRSNINYDRSYLMTLVMEEFKDALTKNKQPSHDERGTRTKTNVPDFFTYVVVPSVNVF